MKRFCAFILGAFLAFSYGNVSAQVMPGQCKSEFPPDLYYDCGDNFIPVCACDGVTYRNPCSAQYHGGILSNQYRDGPCEPFRFFIRPNPASNLVVFELKFGEFGGSGTFFIADIFGKVYLQQAISQSNNFPYRRDFDLSVFTQGVYFMVLTTNNHVQIEKLLIAK